MPDELKMSLKKSTQCFNGLLLPELLKTEQFHSGTFYSLEQSTDEACKCLDQIAKIDYIFKDKVGVIGVASRIQYTDKNDKSYDTFTTNRLRDYSSRKTTVLMPEHYLQSYYAIQAYINKKEQLVSFAITTQKVLNEMIEKGQYEVKHTSSEQIGQASFCVVHWQGIKNIIGIGALTIKEFLC